MRNFYKPEKAQIIKIKDEAEGIKKFYLKLKKKFSYQPGQIIEISYPGYGESPVAPCGKIGQNYLEVCIRKVGRVTEKLHSLKVGDFINFRGPYGNGNWPAKIKDLKNKNLLIVVGGLGLIPLRTLLLGKNKFLGKNSKIQIFYGAKTPAEFLFKEDLRNWKNQGIDVNLTIDKACAGWKECTGVVTVLFDKVEVVQNSLALLCGPPIMYRFILEKLKAKGFKDDEIFMSLERRMHCGVGVCQHCAVGTKYVCHDGPVFSYEEIKNIQDAV